MKKYFAFLLLCFSLFALKAQKNNAVIDKLMTEWHHAAAIADFDAYFGALHENSIYMGTDATEKVLPKDGLSKNCKFKNDQTKQKLFSFAKLLKLVKEKRVLRINIIKCSTLPKPRLLAIQC